MRLPIDTTAVRFITAGPAEPVLDFETRMKRADVDGVPLFNVHLFAVGNGTGTRSRSRSPGSPRASASSPRSRSPT